MVEVEYTPPTARSNDAARLTISTQQRDGSSLNRPVALQIPRLEQVQLEETDMAGRWRCASARVPR